MDRLLLIELWLVRPVCFNDRFTIFHVYMET